MSSSFNTQSSQSSSSPTFLETPENALIDAISQYSRGLAQQMHEWASNEFAHTSGVTNQAVGNFFNVSQQMLGMSNKMTDQYNNITAPDYQQLHDEANSYASPARMAMDMGQAGARQAQAGDAARHNSEENLKSFGVDPTTGRYASLDEAAEVQNAANIVGAQNTQRNADIATGHDLRKQSLAFGATLPSSISNINNTAIQANAGAANASLANANTGVNMKSLADKYLQTAMGIKLPPTGQNTQATGSGFGSSSSPSHDSSSGSRSGGGGLGGGGLGGGLGGGSSSTSGDGWSNPNNYTQPTTYGGTDSALGALDTRHNQYDASDFGGQGGALTMGGLDGQGYNGPSGDAYSYDNSDPGYNSGGWGGDAYTSSPDTSGYSGGGWGGDPYTSAGADYSSPESFGYAKGGAIPDGGIIQSKVAPRPMPPRPGMSGPLPPSMSPSGGQQVDDIQAQGPGGSQLQLNANEFVIPDDVVKWKGQEFFQNLISQSRQKRVAAPAHGKPTQPTR